MISRMSPNKLIDGMIAAALDAADPAQVVKNGLTEVEITADRIFLVSVGKAAVAMADAAVRQFGGRIVDGVVTSKLAAEHPSVAPIPDHFTYFQAGHPIPDERSIYATQTIREMLMETTAADHVLCCISGGASALLTAPVLPLSQWQALNAPSSIAAVRSMRSTLSASSLMR